MRGAIVEVCCCDGPCVEILRLEEQVKAMEAKLVANRKEVQDLIAEAKRTTDPAAAYALLCKAGRVNHEGAKLHKEATEKNERLISLMGGT